MTIGRSVGMLFTTLIITVTAGTQVRGEDVVHEWATNAGAVWMEDLVETAQAVARGEAATFPRGSVAAYAGGVSGYTTLEKALAGLGPAPTSGFIAAWAFQGISSTWSAGYATVVEIVQTTVPPTTVPPPTTVVQTTVPPTTVPTPTTIPSTTTVPPTTVAQTTTTVPPTTVVQTTVPPVFREGTSETDPQGRWSGALPVTLVLFVIGVTGARMVRRIRRIHN
jgi:hypothetical protein